MSNTTTPTCPGKRWVSPPHLETLEVELSALLDFIDEYPSLAVLRSNTKQLQLAIANLNKGLNTEHKRF